MVGRIVILLAGLLAMLWCVGCNGTLPTERETRLDQNWGKSFQAVKTNQVLNPDAGKNLEPVTGMHGETAHNNVTKCRGGVTAQTPAN
jgi:hypothetical protein